jgi:hypothetical protein
VRSVHEGRARTVAGLRTSRLFGFGGLYMFASMIKESPAASRNPLGQPGGFHVPTATAAPGRATRDGREGDKTKGRKKSR